MSVKQFFDTNILVYACDSSEPQKQREAIARIADASRQGIGALSAQVFGEFFHATVVRRSLLSAAEAERLIRAYQPVFTVVSIDYDLVCAAIALHQRYQVRYWDSLIVAAAGQVGCTELLSEDLNHGQLYDGVRVINPFLP